MIKNVMKNMLGLLGGLFLIFPAFAEHGEPGSFKDAAPANLKAVLAVDSKINPAANELVIYYVRPDKNYEPWALWMWAVPGGDGNANWNYTQKWQELDGVGYMRFRLDGSDTGGQKPVSADGTVGLIVRQKSGWIKDGNDDRIWNTGTSRKVAIFSGDQTTYAALPYKPNIKSAELVAPNKISLVLSGAYGLDDKTSGFAVKANGKTLSVAKVYNSISKNPEDNMADHVTVELADNADISENLTVSNPAFLSEAKVNSQKLAFELAEKTVPADDVVLGASYSNKSVAFRLWAPTSSSAIVNLYKKGDAKSADFTVSMEKDASNGVWTAVFNKVDPDGFFYDYTLTNSKGTVTVLDPYARSMAAYHNDGTLGRGAVVDLTSARSLPEGGMSGDYYPLEKREDAVIYEMSVRDFTICSDSGVKAAPGTYKAFIEKIPYLKELGITHVQLMPVVNFYYNNETDRAYDNRGVVNNSNYNWGYDPHNYFTPEGWYATDAADPYCRIRELRELVNECHKAGLGVLLDVVYNHMAGTRFLDDIVPGYYFRMNGRGGFTSNSGCGNDTATEHKMMARIVKDSTEYWVREFKVDGFRFDLMGLMEAGSVENAYSACVKVNPHVLFEGEGWRMYNGEAGTVGMDQAYMRKTDHVAVFNDELRDMLKAGGFNEAGLGLITGKEVNGSELLRSITGNPRSYGVNQPGANIQYMTCHDGLTLHDLISHNVNLKEEKPADKAEIIRRIKMGNALALSAQGIAFLHGGQERGRSKPNVSHASQECIGNFVRNSYDSSDNINQFVWTLDNDYQTVLDYTKGLIALRRTTDVFRMADAAKIKKNTFLLSDKEDKSLVFAYRIHNDDGDWLVAVNASTKNTVIKSDVALKKAEVLVDAANAGTEPLTSLNGVKLSGKKITLDPLTATIIHVKK
ncbi:alpha-amylase family glycosyl hydrolase [uncultured Treponema sp.]|uniref:alpha-amylase family glycosyl hydrolase n=1 Tax=uncultured Treponema sp. TaxID=162155 RepID=UPI0025EC8524|nr:alpha-amylase family glycosyl hydrolase [uncultured Treponema sp.]